MRVRTLLAFFTTIMGIQGMLPAVGITAQKQAGLMMTQLSEKTQNLMGGYDASAHIHHILKGMSNDCVVQLAHMSHSYGSSVLPKPVKDVFRVQVKSYYQRLKEILNLAGVCAFMDGRPNPSKAAEDDKRKHDRVEAFREGQAQKVIADELERKRQALLELGEFHSIEMQETVTAIATAKEKSSSSFKQCLYRHEKVTEYYIALCREFCITVYTAHTEADALLAYNVMIGNIGVAFVEDGDFIAYPGMTAVYGGINFFRQSRNASKFSVAFVTRDDIFKKHTKTVLKKDKAGNVKAHEVEVCDMTNWTQLQFQVCANVMGSDYCNLKGFGIAKAKGVVERLGTRMIEHLDEPLSDSLLHVLTTTNGLPCSAPDAHKMMMLGIASYQCQYVYDIKTYKQQRFNPEYVLEKEYEGHFGTALPQVCIRNVCMCGYSVKYCLTDLLRCRRAWKYMHARRSIYTPWRIDRFGR